MRETNPAADDPGGGIGWHNWEELIWPEGTVARSHNPSAICLRPLEEKCTRDESTGHGTEMILDNFLSRDGDSTNHQ